MSEAQLLALFGVGAGALWAVVWYLIRLSRQQIETERVERQLSSKEERLARESAVIEERRSRETQAAADRKLFMDAHEKTTATFLGIIEKEREQAREDRHDFRDALGTISNHLNAYKLDASERFINREALSDVMAPVQKSLDGLRGDIRSVYEKLDSKVDK